LAYLSPRQLAALEGYYDDVCRQAEAEGRPLPSEPEFWWRQIVTVEDWPGSVGEALRLRVAEEHDPAVPAPTAELLHQARVAVLVIRRWLLRHAAEERKRRGWSAAAARLAAGEALPPPLAKEPEFRAWFAAEVAEQMQQLQLPLEQPEPAPAADPLPAPNSKPWRRPPGPRGYDDTAFLEEMHRLLAGDSDLSRWQAAMGVVARAKGVGTDRSKATRLVGKYRDRFDHPASP
jgi:hypothetical protein